MPETVAPTGLDAVTLKDLYAAFADFAEEESLGVEAFTACLQRMGIGIPALAERLFHAFDHDRSGRLDFRAFATGMSLICNDASAADRLELTFSVLTNHTAVGLLAATEIKSFVREFLWAAMDVVQGLMHTTSLLFVPHDGSGGAAAAAEAVEEGADARRAAEAAAAAQVDRVAEAITQEAMSASGLCGRELAEGEGLGREEFRRWAVAQPRLLTWVSHLGKQWRVAIAEQATSVARAAATTTAAQFGDDEGAAAAAVAEIDLAGVREVVFGLKDWPGHAQQTLDEAEFGACMRKLGMKNEALAEHLFSAFDVDGNGFVDPSEFAAGLARMCSSSAADQLELAWRMFDMNQDVQVSQQEFGRFIASFSALGLAQVQRHIDLFHDIFGAAGGSHGSFGQAVWSAAHERMDAHTARLVGEVFSHAGGGGGGASPRQRLDREQFQAWFERTPAFSAWLGRTGATLATVVSQLRTAPGVAQMQHEANDHLASRMALDAVEQQHAATQAQPSAAAAAAAAAAQATALPAASGTMRAGIGAERRARAPGGGYGDAAAAEGDGGGRLTPRLRALDKEREERDRERERRANERHQRLLHAQRSTMATAAVPPSVPSAMTGSAALPSGGGGGSTDTAGASQRGDFRQFRDQLYSSLSGAGLPVPPQRPAGAQDFRFLTEWLLRMREVQSHGQGELRMARNEIARLMDRAAALEKLVREKDNEIVTLRDDLQDLQMSRPAQVSHSPQQQIQQLTVAGGPTAVTTAPTVAGGPGGVGLRDMADELGRLEELLNEKNRATAELKATSASVDEVVLSSEDYEALRNECKKRAREVDNLERKHRQVLNERDEQIAELQDKLADMEYTGEQATAVQAASQAKNAEISLLEDKLREKEEELQSERQKAIDAEDREAAGMQAMGWDKETGNKAAALVAAEQEQNKLLTARIESLTADREDKRRRHREELDKLRGELEVLKTAATKGSLDKRSSQKEKEKALEKDASDLRMQVNKLQRDCKASEKSRQQAESQVKRLEELAEQREAELSELKRTADNRKRAMNKAKEEATQAKQELARLQRRSGGDSASSVGTRQVSEPDPAEDGAATFARLAEAFIPRERERLVELFGAMTAAEVADTLRNAEAVQDPVVRALGFAIQGSNETIVQQLLAAIQASEDATAAAGELFPDTAMSEADTGDGFGDDDEDDFDEVDDYMASKRRARGDQ
jgi:Ca2+-binding EF-hand superfamily protein